MLAWVRLDVGFVQLFAGTKLAGMIEQIAQHPQVSGAKALHPPPAHNHCAIGLVNPHVGRMTLLHVATLFRGERLG